MSEDCEAMFNGEIENLFGLAHKGDEEAIRMLFLRYRGWIHHSVRAFARPDDDIYEDLVSAGTEAFLKAISKYDSGRNVPFLGYASQWVCGAIRRHWHEVRRNVHVGHFSLEKKGIAAIPVCVSMDTDENVQEWAVSTLQNPEEDLIDGIDHRRKIDLIRSALGCLHPRERRVIEIYFGLDGSGIFSEDRKAVGQILGITPQSVSKYLHNGIVRLRKNLGQERIREEVSI